MAACPFAESSIMTDQKKWEIERLGELTLNELKALFGYEEPEHSPFSGQPLARVFTVGADVQGDYLVGILEQEGIPALYQSMRDTAYDGIFTAQWGHGTIITIERDAYRARTIIEAVLKAIEKENAAEAEETKPE